MNAVVLVQRWRRPLSASQRRLLDRLATHHTVVITRAHVEVHRPARYITAEELFGGSPPPWWVTTSSPQSTAISRSERKEERVDGYG